MAIEFHCNHCGKMVRTGDEHAGKRGRCPQCHQSVYIPTPSDQIELLDLAPIDEQADREHARLMRETREFTKQLLREREPVGGDSRGAPSDPRTAGRAAATPRTASAAPAAPSAPEPVASRPTSTEEMERLIVEYAICMADGELNEAAELSAQIRQNFSVAEEVMQRITLDELPHPQLARIPRPVLVAFFKQLREKR